MTETAHHPGYKTYFYTWLMLLVMTLLALLTGSVDMPGNIKALLLVGVTLAKVVLIASIFMHLRSEKLNLVLITFAPIILSVILFYMMSYDMTETATRTFFLR